MELLENEIQISALEHALKKQIEGMSKHKLALEANRDKNPSFDQTIELLEQQESMRSEQKSTVCVALQYVIDDLKHQEQNKSRTRFEKALLRHEIAGLEARKATMC